MIYNLKILGYRIGPQYEEFPDQEKVKADWRKWRKGEYKEPERTAVRWNTRRALRIVGQVYLWVACIVIGLSYAAIWWFEGFSVLQSIMSPFNLWNFTAVMVTLAPGLLMLHFGQPKDGQPKDDLTND